MVFTQGGYDLSINNSTAIDVLNPVVWDTQGDPPVYGAFALEDSLAEHVINATRALTNNLNYATARDIFANTTMTGYNTNSWIFGIMGYTSLSSSNYPYGTYGPRQGAGTLICSNYAITAWHMMLTACTRGKPACRRCYGCRSQCFS